MFSRKTMNEFRVMGPLRYAVIVIGALALNAALWSGIYAQVVNPGVQISGAVTFGHVAVFGPGIGQIQDGVIVPTVPGGANTQYQFNNGGAFAGSATLTHSGTTDTASGTFNVSAGPFQFGGNAMTFPGVAATLASWGANNVYTGNNSYSGTNLFTGALFAIASNGQASIGGDAVSGAQIKGKGSTFDFQLIDSAGTVVCRVFTATGTMNCPGGLASFFFNLTLATGSPSGNGFYLDSANTPAISSNSLKPQSWNGTATTLFGFITAASLDTAGTVAGSICATSAGLFEYKVGVNCFVAGSGANPTAIASNIAVNGVATSFMRSDAAPAIQLASNAQFGLAECDNVTTVCPSGIVALKYAGAIIDATPSAPTGTASATGVMMGLGSTCKLTPATSTRVKVTFFGSVANSALSQSILLGKFGTGAAPVNGAAFSGTSFGATINATSAVAGAIDTFTMDAVLTGLTPATAYWLDLDLAAASGTATISAVHCSAFEM